MKKTMTLVIVLITSTVLAGCAGNQSQPTPNQQSSIIEELLTFNHELFTLDLPAQFEADESTIKPQSEKDFPQIVYGISEMPKEGSLLSIEKELRKNLCSQTDVCGETTEVEETSINEISGISFTVRYDGRDIDDPAGHVLVYHYWLEDRENQFRFRTFATDLENPEAVKKVFQEIMKTLEVK